MSSFDLYFSKIKKTFRINYRIIWEKLKFGIILDNFLTSRINLFFRSDFYLSNTSECLWNKRNYFKWSQTQFGNTIYNFLNILCAKKWITSLFCENIPLMVGNDLKATIFSYDDPVPGLVSMRDCWYFKEILWLHFDAKEPIQAYSFEFIF